MKRYVAALLVAFALPIATAQTLWSGTSVGMDPQQVLDAMEGTRLAKLPAAKYATGEERLVLGPNIRIAQRVFKSSFYFNNRKLVEVNLLAEPFASDTSTVYSVVVDSLKKTHGQISESTSRKANESPGAASSWRVGSTTITASFWIPAGAKLGGVSIVYSAPLE